MKGTNKMSHTNDLSFTPEEVDQQIERSLSATPDAPEEQAIQQTIQGLKRIYQTKQSDDAPSLERVWQRVLEAAAQESAPVVQAPLNQENTPQRIIPLRRSHEKGPQKTHNHAHRARLVFIPVVVCLCFLLIVGSFVWMTSASRQPGPNTAGIKSARGLYAYLNHAIYRLDSQTHAILWKHPFTNDEFVGELTSTPELDAHKPFVAGSMLYVTILERLTTSKYYLYALNTADGSTLWKEPSPSTKVFATINALYTLVESKTSNISTLTVRDLRTGKLLWQRQYSIVGSDPGRGTEMTEGFRLIAVNDQMLYAVVAYHQNGQNIFARYSLNAKDGSILWHNSEVISGRMPSVEAHIVDGVIYTVEYNLTDRLITQNTAYGKLFDQVVQTQVVAYDAGTGHKRWQTSEMVDKEPPSIFDLILSNDMLYFQTLSTIHPSIFTLHALSTKDGLPRWQYQTNKSTSTMTQEGNNLYMEVFDSQKKLQNVIALKALTGSVLWSTPVKIPDPMPDSSHATKTGDPFPIGISVNIVPVVNNGTVYYSTPDSTVMALRSSDGKILQQFRVDATYQLAEGERIVVFSAS
jgi:outer membrane protein assembly factor BamB